MKRQFASDFLEYDEATGRYYENAEQAVRDDVEKHHWLSVLKIILKDWRLYLMLIPMVLVFLFWRYFPMYELIKCFKDTSKDIPVLTMPYLGFDNFRALLFGQGLKGSFSPLFWQAFRNTFLLSFYGLCFGFPMPIILALFFNEVRSNIVRSVFQVLTYLPKFMSTVVITTLVILLVQPESGATGAKYGLVSQAIVGIITIFDNIARWIVLHLHIGNGFAAFTGSRLASFTAIAQNGLLQVPNYFRAIYQISGIWEGAGYDSIVFFAAVIAVSPTSYEAAQIDGAGKMAQMKYVVLPSILSTVIIMLITRIGHLLSVGYEKVILLRNTGNEETAEVMSSFASNYTGDLSNQSVASAAEMMNNIIGMILVIGANAVARRATDVSLY